MQSLYNLLILISFFILGIIYYFIISLFYNCLKKDKAIKLFIINLSLGYSYIYIINRFDIVFNLYLFISFIVGIVISIRYFNKYYIRFYKGINRLIIKGYVIKNIIISEIFISKINYYLYCKIRMFFYLRNNRFLIKKKVYYLF